MSLGDLPSESFVHPIHTDVSCVYRFVETRMLHATFTFGEYLELTLGSVEQLFVSPMSPFQGGLRVLLAMGDQARQLTRSSTQSRSPFSAMAMNSSMSLGAQT